MGLSPAKMENLEKNIYDLQKQKHNLFKEFNFPEIDGSIHSELVRCGKRSCKCNKGSLHGPYYYLYRYEGGVLKKSYVCPVNKISSKYKEIKQAMKNRFQNKQNRTEIAVINNKILELERKKIEIQDEPILKKIHDLIDWYSEDGDAVKSLNRLVPKGW